MSAPAELRGDLLQERLADLAEAGGERFDPPGYAFVLSLLAKSEALEGPASQRLHDRAIAQLEHHEARFEQSQQRARSELEALDESQCDPTGRIARAYQSGDCLSVFRATRRHRPGPRKNERKDECAAGDPATAAFEDTPADRYRRAAAGVTTSLRLASAPAKVPEGAGPLNGDMLAARTLLALESISESYLISLTERLDDLATLLTLPDARANRRRKGG